MVGRVTKQFSAEATVSTQQMSLEQIAAEALSIHGIEQVTFHSKASDGTVIVSSYQKE